jgi:hypothetical protein
MGTGSNHNFVLLQVQWIALQVFTSMRKTIKRTLKTAWPAWPTPPFSTAPLRLWIPQQLAAPPLCLLHLFKPMLHSAFFILHFAFPTMGA